ncbi:MAG: tetratricopeptide repeat protein [Gammaproteobacteria bacterium]
MIAVVRFAGLITLVALSLLLAACAGGPVSSRYPPPVIDRGTDASSEAPRARDVPPPVGAPATQPAPSSAVVALAERADRQHRAQDLDAAAASLERALRIEPRNPRLWQRLAAVRLDQGQFDQAIQMAAKSNSLAGGSQSLQARNWQLIAAARRAKGDLAGARAAEQQAARFQ